MSEREVVVLGSEDVRRAIGTARPRGWRWRRPAAELRHAAGAQALCLRLEHPDAPIAVLVTRSERRWCALLRGGPLPELDHDPERVAETVEDCPVIEDLVRELQRAG